MTSILNIAGYKFVALSDLPARQAVFLEKTTDFCLKGTILLGLEGININLAGTTDDIGAFIAFLQNDPLFADMTFRESYSDTQPFRRMRVRIRKEIITLRQPHIHPENGTAPDISPTELKQWLDERREMTLLDTRNAYEIAYGTFDQATHLDLADFGEFPERAQSIPRDKPVIMFCTGGIRCEKAALAMLDLGYEQVYQLKGGILNYFAEVGSAHYSGECFVFDERVTVNASLINNHE